MTTNIPQSTLIVGLGNPILGDDGAGWRVAEEVSKESGIPMGQAHRVAVRFMKNNEATK